MLNFYHHTPLHHSCIQQTSFVYSLNVEKRPKVRRKGVFFEAIFKAANLKAHKTLRLVACNEKIGPGKKSVRPDHV